DSGGDSVWNDEFDDPTGEVGDIDKSLQAQITVTLNIVYDSQANGGDGLTDKEKSEFGKMLAETEAEYGQIGIKFHITTTSGHFTYDEHQDLTGFTGAQKNGINVFVITKLGISETGAFGGPGASSIQHGIAASYIGTDDAKHWTLSHELAHHFTGNTKGEGGVLKNTLI